MRFANIMELYFEAEGSILIVSLKFNVPVRKVRFYHRNYTFFRSFVLVWTGNFSNLLYTELVTIIWWDH
jgi:hypothetical protein